MSFPALLPFGWGDRWAALLADTPDTTPARVVRHDGSGVVLATPDGIRAVQLGTRLDPEPAVGDWLALDAGDQPIAVLPRTSLLRRASARGDHEQPLAANVDLVLLVCGLDRPVKPGRLQRGATLAWDAGAVPAIVLTKAALHDDPDAVAAEVADANPGLDVVVTSAHEGVGVEEVRRLLAGRTTTVARRVRRRQVQPRQRLARRGGRGDRSGARRRRQGSAHDDGPPAPSRARWRGHHRHARACERSACGSTPTR